MITQDMLKHISHKCPYLTEMVVHLPTIDIGTLVQDCAPRWTHLEKLHLLGEPSTGKEIQMEHLLPFVDACHNLTQVGWRSRVWKVHRHGQYVRLDLYKQIYIPSVFSVCTEYRCSSHMAHAMPGYPHMRWKKKTRRSVRGKTSFRGANFDFNAISLPAICPHRLRRTITPTCDND